MLGMALDVTEIFPREDFGTDIPKMKQKQRKRQRRRH